MFRGGRLTAIVTLFVSIVPGIGLAATSAPRPVATWQVLAPQRASPLFHDGVAIAVDRWQNTYIADPLEGRVKKFGPRGHLAASWGTDTPGPLHWSPQDVAIDAQGNAYVLAGGITKLSPSGRLLARWTAAPLSGVVAIAVGGRGNLFVLSAEQTVVNPGARASFNARVDKLSPQGRVLATWRTPRVQLEGFTPNGMAVGSRGSVYLTVATTEGCYRPCVPTTALIYKFNSGGKPLPTARQAGVAAGPISAVDSAGNMYMTPYDGTDSYILKLSPAGIVLGRWGKYGCGPGAYGDLLRVALDGQGLIHLADSHVAQFPAYAASGVIHILSPAGQPLAQWGAALSCSDTTFPMGEALTVGRLGTIYFTGGANDAVYTAISPAGRLIRRFGSTRGGSFRIYSPEAIAKDAQGNVYLTDDIGRCVDRFSASGQFTAQWHVLGPDDGLLQGLALDRRGNIYVSASAQGRVIKLSPRGAPLASFGTRGKGPGQFLGPGGLAVDGRGNLYVADTFNNRIQKLSPSGRFLAAWGYPARAGVPSQFDRPAVVRLDSHGNVYVLDSFRARVVELSPAGRQLAVWGQPGIKPGQLDQPSDLAIDAHGNLYIMDSGNNRIQKLSRAA